jgi:hypothetical protein
MCLEEMFEKGITPLTGPNKGERMCVVEMDRLAVRVRGWNSMKEYPPIRHGDYKIWDEV